jgi:hypothetical protein
MVSLAKLLNVPDITTMDDVIGNDANKNKILAALKKASFSTGGLVEAVGEDGISLVKHGEYILKSDMFQILKDFSAAAPVLKSIVNATTPNISSISNITNNKNSSPMFNFDSMITINGSVSNSDIPKINSAGDEIITKLSNLIRQK